MAIQNLGAYLLAVVLICAGTVLALLAHWRRHRSRAAIFALPDSRRPPPCGIRLLRADDFEACEAIYRLNEAHFPSGGFDAFSEALRGREALFLVAESHDRLVAFAGLSMRRTGRSEMASLVYGMVHPSFQRQGYGSLLLRARLAMLPLARRVWIVGITVTGGSESFYSRFGFRYSRPVPIGNGQLLDQYCALVTSQAQKRCARSVAGVLVAAPLGSTYVPAPEVLDSSTQPV